jgi:hypothetical protein
MMIHVAYRHVVLVLGVVRRLFMEGGRRREKGEGRRREGRRKKEGGRGWTEGVVVVVWE